MHDTTPRSRASFDWRGAFRRQQNTGFRNLPEYEPRYLKALSADVESQLARLDQRPDAVLSIHPDPIAWSSWEGPMIVTGDATFKVMVDYYDHFTRLSPDSYTNGMDMVERATSKTDLFAMSSEWATNSLLNDYRVEPQKAITIPYGANFVNDEHYDVTVERIHNRGLEQIKLLSVGVDWNRKGFNSAVAVAARLSDLGYDCTLDIFGASPHATTILPPNVHIHRFVDRGSPDSVSRLMNTWQNASMFLLPSSAECCAIVLAESCSFGVPSIATDVGGNATAIRHDRNGFLIDPSDFVSAAVYAIVSLVQDCNRYKQMSLDCLDEFHARLNWDKFAIALSERIDRVLIDV